jgi:hypothetical protein
MPFLYYCYYSVTKASRNRNDDHAESIPYWKYFAKVKLHYLSIHFQRGHMNDFVAQVEIRRSPI